MPDYRSLFPFPITTTFMAPSAFTGEPHRGIDFATPDGTPIVAGEKGRVLRKFFDPVGGIQLEIESETGERTLFAHLRDTYVSAGQTVSPSTVLGLTGATGTVTGPHLHLERYDAKGMLLDPLNNLTRILPSSPTTNTAPISQSDADALAKAWAFISQGDSYEDAARKAGISVDVLRKTLGKEQPSFITEAANNVTGGIGKYLEGVREMFVAALPRYFLSMLAFGLIAIGIYKTATGIGREK